MTDLVLAVDLAARYSAYSVVDSGGFVVAEGDSSKSSSFEFVDLLVEICRKLSPDIVVVEDVPYGISSQAMIKPVLRLQGVLIKAFSDAEVSPWFVNPSTWQSAYPGVSRGKAPDRIEAARVAAEGIGYTPPNLVQEYLDTVPEGKKPLKKFINPAEKIMTDYIDARLMADWTFANYDRFDSLKGVQPVFM